MTSRPAATGEREAAPALIVIGALCGLLISGSVAAVWANPASTPVDRIVPGLVATVFCATGIVAWWRRPHNRSGSLLVATGISFAVLGLGASDVPGLHDVGVVLGTLPLAMILHVVLAFPSGRLGDAGTRVLVGLGYVIAVGLDAVPGAELVQAVAGIGVLVGAAVVLQHRYRHASPVARSALGPIAWYGPAMLVLLIAGAIVTDVAPQMATAAGVVQFVAIVAFPVVFLVGLTRGAFGRAGEIHELVAEAEPASADPRELEQALARALGDDGVQVWYRRREGSGLVDARGLAHRAPPAPRRLQDVRIEDEVIGAFSYDPSLVAEPALVREVAGLAALLMDRQRLVADLQAQVRELSARDEELRQAQRRIVDAGDDERRRIARDLHDGAQQRIVRGWPPSCCRSTSTPKVPSSCSTRAAPASATCSSSG